MEYVYMLSELQEKELNKLVYLANKKGVFKNEELDYTPYYAVECNCGRDDREFKWLKTHAHKDDCFFLQAEKQEKIIASSLKVNYGERFKEEMLKFAKKKGYTRYIGKKCTCGFEKEYTKYKNKKKHTDECLMNKPNFVHYNSGVCMKWDNNPPTSVLSNMEIDEDRFFDIITSCIESLEAKRDV